MQLKSLTALSFDDRPAPESPYLRPAYQGANPISNIWSAKSIELISENLVTAMENPEDDHARGTMLLEPRLLALDLVMRGYICHMACHTPFGMVREYVPEGYEQVGRPIIPHGMSVILNAPAVFRFTASARPQAHLYAASLMGVDVSDAADEDAGEILANAIIDIMKKTGMPNGLSAVGYTEADVEKLAEGTLPQHRVTKLSPRPADKNDLMNLFRDAMSYGVK